MKVDSDFEADLRPALRNCVIFLHAVVYSTLLVNLGWNSDNVYMHADHVNAREAHGREPFLTKMALCPAA